MKNSSIIVYAIVFGLLAFGILKYTPGYPRPVVVAPMDDSLLVLESLILPISWGDKGQQMQQLGVIDRKAFDTVYAQRGGISADMRAMLDAPMDGQVVMTKDNADTLLNLFWAFGLANKNQILEEGPMMDPRYKGAGSFASTGGWSLAVGDPMNHYSMHAMVALTPEQQALVERVSKNIYRPCCNNSTYFPDCNHGMAMLGLLELMASQNVSEQEMYKTALAVNSFWFPDNYQVIAQSFAKQGIAWKDVDPKVALSAEYSSGSGYANIVAKLKPLAPSGGGSCGV